MYEVVAENFRKNNPNAFLCRLSASDRGLSFELLSRDGSFLIDGIVPLAGYKVGDVCCAVKSAIGNHLLARFGLQSNLVAPWFSPSMVGTLGFRGLLDFCDSWFGNQMVGELEVVQYKLLPLC